MVEVTFAESFIKVEDDLVCGIFGNQALGNVDPRFGSAEDVAANRLKALAALLGEQAAASSANSCLSVMKPAGKQGFVDLSEIADLAHIPPTDGLITTNPNICLSGNPADCAMLAIYGFGAHRRPVLGLIHVGRRIASEGGHRKALAYLADRHGLEPQNAHLIVSPAIHGASYKLHHLSQPYTTDPSWAKYVYQDDDDLWHVDFHTKIIDELQNAGVPMEQTYVSPDDTGSGDKYFSHCQFRQNKQPIAGRNAVIFRLQN
ncbi:MAG: laccase domain-containing protein [Candidatus Saccharimonadales bacterium]